MKFTIFALISLAGSLLLAGCSSSGQAVSSLHIDKVVTRPQAGAIAAAGLPVKYEEFLKVLAAAPPTLRRQFIRANRRNVGRLTPADKATFQQIMSSTPKS